MNAAFLPSHAETLAQKLRDDLDQALDSIAGNDGHISSFGWGRRSVAELTDAEISAYLAGVRHGAAALADWLENAGVIEYKRGGEGWSDLYPIRKHGATCQQIDEDIAGAEGECFHRRHPEKPVFAGRLRKLNALLARIRQFRVELAATYHTGLLSREHWGLKEASDFAYRWSAYDLRRELRKLERRDKSDGEREALTRISAELNASDRAAARVRNAYSDQLRRESDQLCGRRAA